MKISLVVAFDENYLIGNQNKLPWHLPADLKHFKEITMGHYMLMGRKTYESIGKPLPGRTSVIITHNPGFRASGCIIATSLSDAIKKCGNEGEVFIIGGAQVFQEAIKIATHLYATVIHNIFEGDTWFPAPDMLTWKETSREKHEPDEKNKWAYTFINYERRLLVRLP
jgi:dihydrofolate reductase